MSTAFPPSNPAALADFPVRQVFADYPYSRIHHDRFAPEWFCDCGRCRFDLPTGSGMGTCYLAGHPVGAFVEKFGRFRVVPRAVIEQHSLARLAVPSALRVADLTDRSIVGRWGLTAAIWAEGDYALPQAWAVSLHAAGFAGIWYPAAHDVIGDYHSLALFGKAGHQPTLLLSHGDDAVPNGLIDEVSERFGIQVFNSGL